ncbi:hypothetical protein EZV62_021354 [Acer yangbiense]|uniref:Thymidylate synthase n=1 Tax=Acer yangbiense TaxID=1000413 RepID=A0A5C7H6G0_9ROSI|nr:hypothetical protein EZV62_021354 [Acer yangbiense]
MLVAFFVTFITLVRSLVFRDSEQHVVSDSTHHITDSVDLMPDEEFRPPSAAHKFNEADLLSSVLQNLYELEEKVGMLQGKPYQMPFEKEELLNAAVYRVDALEAELIATKTALYEALIKQEELLAYLDNQEERKFRVTSCMIVIFQVLFSSFRRRFNIFASTSAFPPLFKNLNVISKYRSCARTYVMASNSVTSLSNGNASMDPEPRRTYQVVVAATRDMGIGKDGVLPWRLPSDLKFFKELTVTTSDPGKKNAIVMGRKTWESIPSKYRPLPGRLNVVLTRSGSFDISTDENVVICGSILSALELLAQAPYLLLIEKVFFIGGGQILRDSLNAPGCDAIHITEIETSMECDTFIPAIDCSLFQPWYSSQPLSENGIRFSFVTYARVKNFAIGTTTANSELEGNGSSNYNKSEVKNFAFLPKLILEKHDEYMYLRLVKEIISSGNQKDDRTRTGTLSKFGCQMKFNLRRSFPLLTTKRVFWRGVVEELLWFISGSTNAKIKSHWLFYRRKAYIYGMEMHPETTLTGKCLATRFLCILDHYFVQENPTDVSIFLSIGLVNREDGDLGPVYGFQWRHFGASYTNMHADYSGQGFDQLLDVIDKIKNSPDDRRIILSAWNPSDLKLMALPPCHMFAQFHVANGELSCQMYQRSADMGLGVPFNIASYALLTCMIAHVCSLVPGDFIHVIGDAHVYKNHVRPLQEQLQKLPRPFPILRINPEKKDIDSFVASDFELTGYDPHQKIEMKMAV